jgi:hypothetical protein
VDEPQPATSGERGRSSRDEVCKLAAGSLPISFKNLVEGKSAYAERVSRLPPRDDGAPQGELTGHNAAALAWQMGAYDFWPRKQKPRRANVGALRWLDRLIRARPQ